MTKPLIALACIVGNEEHQIERFIRSFAPVVDVMYFVIATGTQPKDKTAFLIGKTCGELGMTFQVKDFPDVGTHPFLNHFGKARQMAWEMAKDKSQFLLWSDADDLVKGESAVKAFRTAAEDGQHDVYLLPYHVRGAAQIVYRERMVRNDGCSMWKYPIHEQLSFTRDVKYKVIHEAVIVHSPFERRHSSKDRNVAILETALEDMGRNLFYLQMEYFGTSDHLNAKKYGLLALQATNQGILEKYEILINLAQCYENWESKIYAARAFELMPDRREALALLTNYAIIDKDFEKAHQLARLMMGIPKPPKSYWTMNHDWYGWKGFYLFTQTLRLMGKGDEARKMEREQFERGGGVKISLLHATRGRVLQSLAARDVWFTRAANPMHIEHIYSLDEDDTQSCEILQGFNGIRGNNRGCADAWNAAAKASNGKVLIQVSDDWIPPMGWDELLLCRIDDIEAPLVIAVNDGHRTDNLLCMAIITRAYYENNGLFHEGFESVYSDNYFTHQAYKAGMVIEARDLVFQHNNPYFQTGNFEADETYSRSNSPERYERGKALFEQLTNGAA